MVASYDSGEVHRPLQSSPLVCGSLSGEGGRPYQSSPTVPGSASD